MRAIAHSFDGRYVAAGTIPRQVQRCMIIKGPDGCLLLPFLPIALVLLLEEMTKISRFVAVNGKELRLLDVFDGFKAFITPILISHSVSALAFTHPEYMLGSKQLLSQVVHR